MTLETWFVPFKFPGKEIETKKKKVQWFGGLPKVTCIARERSPKRTSRYETGAACWLVAREANLFGFSAKSIPVLKAPGARWLEMSGAGPRG